MASPARRTEHGCVTFAVHVANLRTPVDRKTETLNLRISPELKELVKLAAKQQNRTLSNLIEVLVREHCARVGAKAKTKK